MITVLDRFSCGVASVVRYAVDQHEKLHVTQVFAGKIDGIGGEGFSYKRVAVAAVVGGTASKLTGGKFANGAVTGAFSRALNDELHNAIEKQHTIEMTKLNRLGIKIPNHPGAGNSRYSARALEGGDYSVMIDGVSIHTGNTKWTDYEVWLTVDPSSTVVIRGVPALNHPVAGGIGVYGQVDVISRFSDGSFRTESHFTDFIVNKYRHPGLYSRLGLGNEPVPELRQLEN